MTEWKHRQAERDVAPLLSAAAEIDPSIVSVFPRSVPEILAAALPAVGVDIHRERELDLQKIVDILRDQYGILAERLVADGNNRVGGFTYGDEERVVVFVETKFGPEFENFTLAHEAGHVVKDLLPLLRVPRQAPLFARPAAAQPLEVITDGRGRAELVFGAATSKKSGRGNANQREVVANAIAAELLAPWREVAKIAEACDGSPDAIDIVRDCFGLSKRAARIRLEELNLIYDPRR